MPFGRSARIAAVAASLTVLLAACASGSSTPSQGAPTPGASGASAVAPAGGSAVTIQSFAFGPAQVSVPVGASVTWTNQDSTQHTVTADDGSFSSDPLGTGQTFNQTFSKAGTFSYHCKIHPTMKATITVG